MSAPLCSGQNAPWRDALAEAADEYVGKVFTEALGGLPRGITTEIIVSPDEPARALTRIADRAHDLPIIGGPVPAGSPAAGARRWRGGAHAKPVARLWWSRRRRCPADL
jgi:hypothetical protein